MKGSNVIPFRRRAPSQPELEACRRVKRSWSPPLKALMFRQYLGFAVRSGSKAATPDEHQ